MRYEPNYISRTAKSKQEKGEFSDAIKIYLEMADGDPSLDVVYLAMRLGECYESMSDLFTARFWYGRAVEENPTIEEYAEARKRLEDINLDSILKEG